MFVESERDNFSSESTIALPKRIEQLRRVPRDGKRTGDIELHPSHILRRRALQRSKRRRCLADSFEVDGAESLGDDEMMSRQEWDAL